jgi:hypothetical protein
MADGDITIRGGPRSSESIYHRFVRRTHLPLLQLSRIKLLSSLRNPLLMQANQSPHHTRMIIPHPHHTRNHFSASRAYYVKHMYGERDYARRWQQASRCTRRQTSIRAGGQAGACLCHPWIVRAAATSTTRGSLLLARAILSRRRLNLYCCVIIFGCRS